MKKTVLTFGLISAALSSVMMLLTVPFMDRITRSDLGEYVGYTLILLSFLLVFFGVRSYRDNVGGGTVTFGRAFTVGILITLLSCAGCHHVGAHLLHAGAGLRRQVRRSCHRTGPGGRRERADP